MRDIAEVFDRLDRWQGLPAYQLERRADIFFGTYLADVFAKCDLPIDATIIPEFPVKQVGTNLSDKIDYACLSSDHKRLLLVELKTNARGHRSEQIRYLIRASKATPKTLLDELQEVMDASKSAKYPVLVRELNEMGIWGPNAMEMPVACHLVFVQPTQFLDEKIRHQLDEHDVKPTIIDFDMFADAVEATGGVLSARFAKSLRAWASAARREYE